MILFLCKLSYVVTLYIESRDLSSYAALKNTTETCQSIKAHNSQCNIFI